MSSKDNVTLYHNPNCSKSRGALELLSAVTQEKELELRLVEYLNTPPDQKTLTTLLQQLPDAPENLVRNDKNFKALGLDASDYTSTESVIVLLLSHPELMQRPIAVYKNKAAIGRPPKNLLELFE